MKLTTQSNNELLAKQYHWKIAGPPAHWGRAVFAKPIQDSPSGFHTLLIKPKFWMPMWLVVALLRCFSAQWAVFEEMPDHKCKVWIAPKGDGYVAIAE